MVTDSYQRLVADLSLSQLRAPLCRWCAADSGEPCRDHRMDREMTVWHLQRVLDARRLAGLSHDVE
jgi:hypothetical protein